MNTKTAALFKPLHLGPYCIQTPLVLAPMAGVTDRPFRQLCLKLGAGLAVSEMVTSDLSLWHTRKSQQRLIHQDEAEPRMVQIAGADPQQMAQAAQANQALGAQIIDINMGCPAKKVCKKAAGSALLRDETLVAQILEAVVQAVDLPVTLKIRTGWCTQTRNARRIGYLAQEAGIQALTIHGRTRADKFLGQAEYDTLAEVKQALQIPVIANGDITCAHKAAEVLQYTQADALMIGRAAQGQPWIFQNMAHFLRTGEHLTEPSLMQKRTWITEHLQAVHAFYGEYLGVRIARKHVGWYLQTYATEQMQAARATFNHLENAAAQLDWLHAFHQPA
ncbi:tRNA-dihydrouridine synthase B [Allopseudospirillum japonicum]|uniref:tRNA-dihydrouridine synthase B n=1 Tax=Allopseudospirillum japonicum TaxID=64971 RepID=A0A1H6QNB9_9GAMM|nr:tRNA dihydrouridine synthase DusB [Allopseudospirillum japonicum]SEI42464.1 tRNA-dihydrouridine synthase B [Allopseudospirillum japonicum]